MALVTGGHLFFAGPGTHHGSIYAGNGPLSDAEDATVARAGAWLTGFAVAGQVCPVASQASRFSSSPKQKNLMSATSL